MHRIFLSIACFLLILRLDRLVASENAHWAYQPVRPPSVPRVADEGWPLGAIDRFILARLEAARKPLASEASPQTRLRRLTFDLAGRPPTLEEQEAWLANPDRDAWLDVVEKLLASPEFGERWGQHWLDVARYAESSGGGRSLMFSEAWRFRDYVIDAFNNDRPFDQFIVEQLAGDQLPYDSADQRDRQVIATGFLTLGAINYEEQDKALLEMDIVDEQLDAVGRAFLGLSFGCARCHDHKFDPISTEEYYGLAGIFTSTKSVVHANVGAPMTVAVTDGVAMAVVDHEHPCDTPIRYGGDVHTQGPLAPRTFVAAAGIPAAMLTSAGAPNIPEGKSGRLELARWIASPENRLTSRVIANRVWRHLFGEGIVATTDEFGTTGPPPTHPELLDYLAVSFVEEGWSIKGLVRSIVLSRTYGLSSDADEPSHAVELDRALRSRASRRQLDAEALRNAMLAISGQTDPTRGGLTIEKIAQYDTDYQYSSRRRSVYLPRFRNAQPEVLAAFGGANPNMVTGCRAPSIVPTQALFLLNGDLVIETAERTASRLLREADDVSSRVDLIYRLALSRCPTSREADLANRYLGDMRTLLAKGDALQDADIEFQVWSGLCQLLFSSLDFRFLN